MSVDLTKLVAYSGVNAFKNNNVYSGTWSIASQTLPNINGYSLSTTIALDAAPDLLSVLLYSSAEDKWGDETQLLVTSTSSAVAPSGQPTAVLGNYVSGSTVTLTLTFTNQYLDPGCTLAAMTVPYRIVDYSVF